MFDREFTPQYSDMVAVDVWITCWERLSLLNMGQKYRYVLDIVECVCTFYIVNIKAYILCEIPV